MEIRHETLGDNETIRLLTKAAFDPMPFSGGDEADRIGRLREAGDLALSLVAMDGLKIVGHIAFSPVFLDEAFDGWFGLGPVSVWPHLQKRGIGGMLIKRGLDELKQKGALGCVLIGDPGYYHRFGFVGDGRLAYRNLPSRIVQWLAFSEAAPEGVLRFSPGLE